MKETGEVKHRYLYEATKGSAAVLIADMVGDGQKVLELGCGPGVISKILGANGCEVTAIDFDETAINIARPHCHEIIQGDLNASGWSNRLSSKGYFDVVVAGDVLEHLINPWRVLREAVDCMHRHGRIVLSLPNVSHNGVLAGLLNGSFTYRECGLLDRTHLRFFGVNDIQALVQNSGLSITKAEFVLHNSIDTNLRDEWAKLSRGQRKFLNRNTFGQIFQFVIEAKRSGSELDSLNLQKIVTDRRKDAAGSVSWPIRIVGGFKNFLQKLLGRLSTWCRLR